MEGLFEQIKSFNNENNKPIRTIDSKLKPTIYDFLDSVKNTKPLEDIDWTVKELGNGLYKFGPIITGKNGIEEIHKALNTDGK